MCVRVSVYVYHNFLLPNLWSRQQSDENSGERRYAFVLKENFPLHTKYMKAIYLLN